MSITNISSYDVLVDPPMENILGVYQLNNYKKNVGNNRLEVFLALYQSDYDRERERELGDSRRDKIVNDVLNTLYQKCVPTGRFLINASISSSSSNDNINNININDKVWNVMEEKEAKELVHAILRGVPPPDRYKQQQQKQKQQQQRQENEDLVDEVQSSSRYTQPLNDGNNNTKTNPEELKRRRRSSLLRRSASDSLLDDSKKATRFDQQRRRVKEEPTLSSSSFGAKDGTVTLNRMDVILTSSMDALDPNCRSIGNNRLHILVAMQSGKYQQAAPEIKESILDEVVQTVNTFWKGRFLTESSDGYYEILDKADAKQSLRMIFDMRSGQNLFSRSSPATTTTNLATATTATTTNSATTINNVDNKDYNIPIANPTHFNESIIGGGIGRGGIGIGIGNKYSPSSQSARHLGGDTGRPDAFTLNSSMMKHASTSAIPSGNPNTGMISNDTKYMLSRHMSTSLIPTLPPQRQSSSTSPSALEIMNQAPNGVSGIEDLRSAAVKSLQKQKARQQIANRLEKTSMNRNSNFSNSSISNNSSSNFSTSNSNFGSSNFSENNNNNNNNYNNNNNNNNIHVNMSSSSFSMGGRGGGAVAKRRQSSIFGALDPSVMDEIVGSCFDDEDSSK